MSSNAPESIPSGYEVRKSAPLPRLDGHFYDLIHQATGAQFVHLAVPDRNTYFCAGYRTIPDDSTGISHIMEHCVSGGSRRFPPGAGGDMYTRSLVTDLNASTHTDFTNYYFATRNQTDFMNWMEYVVDVSLFARMEEDTFLRQRGHFEFNTPDDPTSGLKFIGTIFNEQKAVFVSAGRHAFRALNQALFPGHTYSHDSGGDHTQVPHLTYEKIMEYNRRHYHPGNAFFLSRGNVPLSSILSGVEDVMGSDFEKRDTVDIPDIPELTNPVVTEAPFPVGQEGAGGQFVMGWVTLPSADSYARLSLQVTVDALMEGPTAPLRRALEESGLVGGVIHPVVSPTKRALVAFYATEVDPKNAPRLESLILETLFDVAAKGLDPNLVDAAITRLELRHREQRGALRVFLGTVIPPLLYRGDAYSAIELDSDLARLATERRNGRSLENLITSQLTDNPHRARVTMLPDSGFEARVREEESRWLKQVEAGLTDQDREKIVNDAKRLGVRPEEPFEKRGLTPKEGFADLTAPKGTKESAAGVPVDVYETATGGITYLSMRIDASGLADELIDYLGLFSTVMSRHARGAADGVELIGLGHHTRVDVNAKKCLHWIELSARALDRDQGQMPELLTEVLEGLEFEPHKLRKLAGEAASGFEQSVMGGAQAHLRRLAGGSLRRSAQIDDRVGGLSQLIFLKKLLQRKENDFAEVVEKLSSIREELLVKSRLALCVTGDGASSLLTPVGELLAGVKEGAGIADPMSDEIARSGPHKARVTQLPVAFTCEAHSIPGLLDPDTPAIAVLGQNLWNGHLNAAVRKVGAYGVDVGAVPDSGLFWMSSRRDPLPATTYGAMTEGIARYREGRWDGPKAEDGVLAALRVSDPVETPATAARRAWISGFTGHTVEAWNTFRKRLLDVTDKDLQAAAEKHLSGGARATLVGPSMLEEGREESKLFDEVIEI